AIVACSLFFIIFLVAGIYVKNVANAGLLAGAKNVYEGKVSSLKESWNNGRKYWVRFFMLELLVALPVILIFLFGIAVAITISLAGEIGDTLIVDMFGLLFVVLVCGALLIVLPLSALKPFAYRLILENDLGSIELLKSSWDIIRIRFSDIFISFLLAGAVTFIISLVLIPAVFMIFIPFMGGVLAGVTLLETSVILGILIIVVASICYLSVLSIFSGILNTYWQHYWTIVFEQVKGGQLQN
ncbi:hypothetical protein KC717_07120, partial [Candidatus Dojkabacteria bacterium]|nr:hypothetical protein [Candidatus Dojkabacteria bacterium]